MSMDMNLSPSQQPGAPLQPGGQAQPGGPGQLGGIAQPGALTGQLGAPAPGLRLPALQLSAPVLGLGNNAPESKIPESKVPEYDVLERKNGELYAVAPEIRQRLPEKPGDNWEIAQENGINYHTTLLNNKVYWYKTRNNILLPEFKINENELKRNENEFKFNENEFKFNENELKINDMGFNFDMNDEKDEFKYDLNNINNNNQLLGNRIVLNDNQPDLLPQNINAVRNLNHVRLMNLRDRNARGLAADWGPNRLNINNNNQGINNNDNILIGEQPGINNRGEIGGITGNNNNMAISRPVRQLVNDYDEGYNYNNGNLIRLLGRELKRQRRGSDDEEQGVYSGIKWMIRKVRSRTPLYFQKLQTLCMNIGYNGNIERISTSHKAPIVLGSARFVIAAEILRIRMNILNDQLTIAMNRPRLDLTYIKWLQGCIKATVDDYIRTTFWCINNTNNISYNAMEGLAANRAFTDRDAVENNIKNRIPLSSMFDYCNGNIGMSNFGADQDSFGGFRYILVCDKIYSRETCIHQPKNSICKATIELRYGRGRFRRGNNNNNHFRRYQGGYNNNNNFFRNRVRGGRAREEEKRNN